MQHRVFVRAGALAVGAVTIGGLGALTLPFAASAAPTCTETAPAAVLISSSICEIRITTSGSYTFPTGIAKLSAVLVGGGGGGTLDGGTGGYAGDGGSVEYIDTVALGTPLTITVGAGGAGGPLNTGGTPGTDTSVGTTVASGGSAAFFSYGGQGAAGASTGNTGGPGYLLENVPGVDTTLFPAGSDTAEYGRGGDGWAGSGDPSAEPTAAQTTPGDGGQGILASTSEPTAGVDGIVILRFAAEDIEPSPSPTPSASASAAPGLAATGANAIPGVVAGAGLLAGGAIVLGLRRRRAARSR